MGGVLHCVCCPHSSPNYEGPRPLGTESRYPIFWGADAEVALKLSSPPFIPDGKRDHPSSTSPLLMPQFPYPYNGMETWGHGQGLPSMVWSDGLVPNSKLHDFMTPQDQK